MKSLLPLCAVLLVLAGAIVFHAANGRYAFVYSDRSTYAKMDTRTGEAWLCGAELDQCMPLTNKAAFVAYADRLDTIDDLQHAGFSDDEIKEWANRHGIQWPPPPPTKEEIEKNWNDLLIKK